MKNILVTGAAGFIGSNIVRHHLKQGDKVWGVDNLQAGNLKNLASLPNQSSFKFDQADIRYWPNIKEAIKSADYIYHMAAVVGQKQVFAKPIDTLLNNIDSCKIILETMANIQSKARILLASSSSVYYYSQPDENGALHEEANICLKSGSFTQQNYPSSKFINELMGLSFCHEAGIDCIMARLFNVIGINQSSSYGMVVPTFIEQALSERPITVHGTGEQTRSFIDVRDIIRAFELLLNNPASKGQVINVGDDHEHKIIDLAHLVLKTTQSNSKITYLPYKKAYGVENYVDVDRRRPYLAKLRQLTNFRPHWAFEQTLQTIVQSYKTPAMIK